MHSVVLLPIDSIVNLFATLSDCHWKLLALVYCIYYMTNQLSISYLISDWLLDFEKANKNSL